MQRIAAPCALVNFLVIRAGIIASTVNAMQKGMSIKSDIFAIGRLPPLIIAHTGSIKHKSITLAPIMFPTDKSCFFFTIEVMVVTNSGKEVPMATIVTAIILSGMCI